MSKHLVKPLTEKKCILPPVKDRFDKEQLQEIIEKNFGVVTLICNQLDCTYKQFYNALDYYDLRNYLLEAKKQIVGLAEKAIVDCLSSENEAIKMKSAEITLKSLGKQFGWNFSDTQINTQINVNDKETTIKQIFGV